MEVQIRIQGAKPNADPDSGQTLKSKKVEFLHKKYTESR